MSQWPVEHERRRHERKRFRADQAGLAVLLRVDDQEHKIRGAHDVSISGIRIAIDHPLEVGQSVTLLAEMDDMDVGVAGEVRWCRQGQSEHVYESGIEFDNDDPDNNILFFMSMRKFLDEFDDEPYKEL